MAHMTQYFIFRDLALDAVQLATLTWEFLKRGSRDTWRLQAQTPKP